MEAFLSAAPWKHNHPNKEMSLRGERSRRRSSPGRPLDGRRDTAGVSERVTVQDGVDAECGVMDGRTDGRRESQDGMMEGGRGESLGGEG